MMKHITWKNVQVTLLLLQVKFHVVSSPDNKSNCTAYSVNEHDPAEVTFYFSSNLNTTKQDFQIRQNNNTVLSCDWYDGKLDCFPRSGFELENPITDKVVLKISEAKLENAGNYKLHVSKNNPDNEESCNLEVRGPSFTPVLTIENSSTTASFKNGTLDDEDQREIFSKSNLYFLFLLLLLVPIFYCTKKRHSVQRILFNCFLNLMHNLNSTANSQNDDKESQTCDKRGTPDNISKNKDTEETRIEINVKNPEEAAAADTSFGMERRSYSYQHLNEIHKTLATFNLKVNSELPEPKPCTFECEQSKYPHEVVSETEYKPLLQFNEEFAYDIHISDP